MILLMTLEHCFTKTLAIYVSCARLVFHSFPNWLLVLSEHRLIQAPDAGSVAAPLWWRLRIRLRDRHCCRNRQHLSRSQRTPRRGLLLVLYTTWSGSFESVVISMGGARKCNTFTQLVHVTCTPHNFGVLCKSWCRERTMRDGFSGLLTLFAHQCSCTCHESSIPSFPNDQIVKCQAAPFVFFVTLRVTPGHCTMSAVTLVRD